MNIHTWVQKENHLMDKRIQDSHQIGDIQNALHMHDAIVHQSHAILTKVFPHLVLQKRLIQLPPKKKRKGKKIIFIITTQTSSKIS